MKNNTINKGYKSVSHIYDDYILSEKPLFKIISKIIWGFTDKEYAMPLLENIPDNFSGKILDIPAGTGILTHEKYLKLKNAEIVCMDYSNDMLDIAKKRFEDNNLYHTACKQGDVGNIPFENETFDAVLSMNGFHAFPDKEKAFSEIHRVLKNNGFFTGCFYIKGKVRRTDWFIKNIFVKNGTFTPPFYNENEIVGKLKTRYKETKIWNKGSIICFTCKK
ncbi:MAG: class I SAM-dependent methyltransferase [Tannerella sp.]|jgi:ubiquinone/menaquinone biosynthesis C-methylase UbiE|nr:class I SAM-dependent methyltransferase [Tannerella sp.]